MLFRYTLLKRVTSCGYWFGEAEWTRIVPAPGIPFSICPINHLIVCRRNPWSFAVLFTCSLHVVSANPLSSSPPPTHHWYGAFLSEQWLPDRGNIRVGVDCPTVFNILFYAKAQRRQQERVMISNSPLWDPKKWWIICVQSILQDTAGLNKGDYIVLPSNQNQRWGQDDHSELRAWSKHLALLKQYSLSYIEPHCPCTVIWNAQSPVSKHGDVLKVRSIILACVSIWLLVCFSGTSHELLLWTSHVRETTNEHKHPLSLVIQSSSLA